MPRLGAVPVALGRETYGTANSFGGLSVVSLAEARDEATKFGTVLDWATAVGYRSADNPVNGIATGLPKQPKKQGRHTALV